MSIEQEVTGPDSLFNDPFSSSRSLLHKIEYILTPLARVRLRSNSHSPASYRSEESRPYLGIDIQLGNSHVYCMLDVCSWYATGAVQNQRHIHLSSYLRQPLKVEWRGDGYIPMHIAN